MSCTNRKFTDKYGLGIYDFSEQRRSGTAIGFVECSGIIHGLPKSILKVELKRNSILSLERKVLIEKFKLIEEIDWMETFSFNNLRLLLR